MTQPRHVVLVSGGKDSTALALYLRDTRPELDIEYVFCDTQKELPETYEFLVRLEAYLEKPIVRLCSEQSDRGFDHWLKVYGDYLPAPQMRWCTKKLKIEPFEKYVGDDLVFLYIGIRADERRDGYISTKANMTPVYPFKDDGIVKDDVIRILEESGVGLPQYYSWRSRSGCYFCFFQQRAEWVRLREQHPDLWEKAKTYEKPKEGFTWVQGESLMELEKPERIEQIKKREVERQTRLKARRKARNLAEVFGAVDEDSFDDDTGCLICHL